VATHPNFISRYSDHDRRRFQTNKERLACGCRKRGRLFHTVSSGTGTEPHSASAWLPRGTSATKITTYQSRKVYFEDLIFAFLSLHFRNHKDYSHIRKFLLQLASLWNQSFQAASSRFIFFIILSLFLKVLILNFLYPPTRRVFSILSSLPCL